ncbi:hypothetical protein GGQ85_004322 [Nitrobacter vulgaris]|nr:hypothetical protein [Nitrobacter vulgaris]
MRPLGEVKSDTNFTAQPTPVEGALVDIQTLVRFALHSGDQARVKRDLEMILTITEDRGMLVRAKGCSLLSIILIVGSDTMKCRKA